MSEVYLKLQQLKVVVQVLAPMNLCLGSPFRQYSVILFDILIDVYSVSNFQYKTNLLSWLIKLLIE